MRIKERVLGCLVAAAYADAMGSPTETRTTNQIKEYFNGPVTTLIEPPADVFARGNKAGQVTDDFSMAYITCKEILKNNGVVTDEVAINSLIEWSTDTAYFEQFVGPTSRAGINRLKNNEPAPKKVFVSDNLKASNGASMKAAPISLFGAGDFIKTMNDIITIASPTHFNCKSLSGACAVAGAVAACFKKDSTILDVYQGALEGAKYGEGFGDQIAGPSVYRRIKMAVAIAVQTSSMDECRDAIASLIGNGPMSYETVPAAIALLVKAGNRPNDAIVAAVNIGNDTDTIATIVGGIAGALYGNTIVSKENQEIIDKANNYNLKEMAQKITDIIEKEGEN